MLEVRDFSLHFRRYDGLLKQQRTSALEGLDLRLGRGEVMALVGASGAGKSLLAHALFGILPPNAETSGEMLLDGVRLDAQSWPALRGRRMGLVPQSIGHLDPLVRCGTQLGWAARRSGRASADIGAALTRFGLSAEAARAFPHQLSGGMARRMMLAIATIGSPDLVVADEVTSGLDPEIAQVVLDHLRRIADEGRSVLLITHDLARALPFADRVALLSNGRLAGIEAADCFTGSGERLQSPYARALWRAMPENDFASGAATDA